MSVRPRCVIVTGRPGSGKTTLSRKLCKVLHMPLLSRDEVKEGFVATFGVRHDDLPQDTNRRVLDLFVRAVRTLLEGHVSLVAEAAFQHGVWEAILAQWSGVGDPRFVICDADPELCARRHLERGLSDPRRLFNHGDARVREFLETGEFKGPGEYEAPSFDVPTLKVSTVDEYVPGLDEIRDFVL